MKRLLGKIYYAIKHKYKLQLSLRNWQKAKKEIESSMAVKTAKVSQGQAVIKNVLIYPSDLNTIVGALGDDAMISASLDQIRKLCTISEVFVLCKPKSVSIVEKLGFKPLPMPDIGLDEHPQFFKDLYERLAIGYFIALGADIMDGYYGVMHPASALIAADLAVSSGIQSIILGFSFNKEPNAELFDFYKKTDKRVSLNVRDKISLERFRKFTTANGTLVADAAFCLIPESVPANVQEWVEKEKNNGRVVIGFNVHPMLLKNISKDYLENIISSAVSAIESLSKEFPVSFILLPHDYRGLNGDLICLQPIFDHISKNSNIRAFVLEGEYRASELKAIAGIIDGVITGRMHLAIASLGMGTPTLCITYQDKFEGLYQHFSLPSSLLIPPEKMMDVANFTNEISFFIKDLLKFKEVVASNKNNVIALSEKNFSTLK